MELVPVILFWILSAWCALRGVGALLVLLAASLSFGSLAVVPPSLVGGLTMTPTSVVTLVIVARCFTNARGLDFLASLVVQPQRLTWLMLFWVIAVATTFFMPRLFRDDVEIVPLRQGMRALSLPVAPSTQNISQLAYLTISVFLVFAVAQYLRSRGRWREVLCVFPVAAYFAIATGCLDYLGGSFAMDKLLGLFRTATYTLLIDAQVLGAKRVVGLMPEASSFGSLCLALMSALYFLRRSLVAAGVVSATALSILIPALAIFIWLSTSTAAIVGLLVLIAAAVFEWGWRASTASRRSPLQRGLSAELAAATIVLAIACLGTLLIPDLWHPLLKQLDVLILSKPSSSSFEERGLWNHVSLQALKDTWGLGVGVGSTRASSAVVALASNVGIVGSLCYFLFVVTSFFHRSRTGAPFEHGIAHGAGFAFLPPFATMLLIGSTSDFGALNAILFGLAAGAASGGAVSAVPSHRHVHSL